MLQFLPTSNHLHSLVHVFKNIILFWGLEIEFHSRQIFHCPLYPLHFLVSLQLDEVMQLFLSSEVVVTLTYAASSSRQWKLTGDSTTLSFPRMETKKLGRLKVLEGHPEVLKPRSPSNIVGLRPPNSPAGTWNAKEKWTTASNPRALKLFKHHN